MYILTSTNVNEQTLFLLSQYLNEHSLAVVFYANNILQTSISQVLRLDIVFCHSSKHPYIILWHRRVITSITPAGNYCVNYWATTTHPIMPNCALENTMCLRLIERKSTTDVKTLRFISVIFAQFTCLLFSVCSSSLTENVI